MLRSAVRPSYLCVQELVEVRLSSFRVGGAFVSFVVGGGVFLFCGWLGTVSGSSRRQLLLGDASRSTRQRSRVAAKSDGSGRCFG